MLVWFLLNNQKKPERWHKRTATLRPSHLLKGACFNGDVVELCRFSGGLFGRFSGGCFGGFSGGFFFDFSADFSVAFAWNHRRIFLENLPKPYKTKGLRDFL